MNDRFSSLSRMYAVLLISLIPFFSQAQTVLDSLPPIDSLSDRQVNEYVRQFTAHARHFEQILSEQSTTVTTKRIAIEEVWKTVKADSTTAKAVIDSLAGLLKTAKSAEKTAIKQQNQAVKTLELANKTAEADSLLQRKNLRKLWKELRQLDELIHPVIAPVKPVEADSTSAVKDKKRDKKKKPDSENPPADLPVKDPNAPPAEKLSPDKRTKKYDPNADVMLHPPALPCQMAVNTRDEFSGELYRRTMAVELFRHTPAPLKNYLQGKSNVQCDAALAAAGVNAALHLTFTIHDPNPRKAFGKLDKNSLMTLWFMDGSTMFLYNQQADEGVQNPDDQSFVFHAQYALTAEVVKKLRRMELDKIRIAWSSGYEDYDVQYVQLLMQQAKCLFD